MTRVNPRPEILHVRPASRRIASFSPVHWLVFHAPHHSKQHWVPVSYLKAWCDPNASADQEPYVWMHPKDCGPAKRKAPKSIFYEREMYTDCGPGGERDLWIEEGLSRLESQYVSVRDTIVRHRKTPSEEDRAILCLFYASMQVRSRMSRDHHRGQWGRVRERADKLRAAVEALDPEERARRFRDHSPIEGPSLSHDDVVRFEARPMQEFLVDASLGINETLIRMRMTILCAQDGEDFVSSDAPCVWRDADPRSERPQWMGIGLALPSIELSLPLSPCSCLVLSWAGPTGYVELNSDQTRKRANLLRRIHCEEYLVSRREAPPLFE